jgi:hypothetical protein
MLRKGSICPCQTVKTQIIQLNHKTAQIASIQQRKGKRRSEVHQSGRTYQGLDFGGSRVQMFVSLPTKWWQKATDAGLSGKIRKGPWNKVILAVSWNQFNPSFLRMTLKSVFSPGVACQSCDWSFRPQEQTPGVPHVRSSLLSLYDK